MCLPAKPGQTIIANEHPENRALKSSGNKDMAKKKSETILNCRLNNRNLSL